MASPLLRVFISSTSIDLEPYRAAARDVVIELGWYPVMMEYFVASPASTVVECQRHVLDSDLFLLIIAFRKGWVPTVEQGGDGERSITAWEMEAADRKVLPRLVLMARDTWPGSLWEDDGPARAWLKDFRANLNRIATLFDYEAVEAGATE